MPNGPIDWSLFNKLENEAATRTAFNPGEWSMLRSNLTALERGWENFQARLTPPSHLQAAKHYAEGIRMAARFIEHEPAESSIRDLVSALFIVSRWIDMQPSGANRD